MTEDYSLLSPHDVAAKLGTDLESGRTDNVETLKEIRKTHGSNVMTPPKLKTVLELVIDNLRSLIMLLLIGAAIISLFINEYIDGVGVLIAITISTTVAVLTKKKSDKSSEALKALADNNNVKVIRAGKITEIKSTEIVVGDIIQLEPGDKIPADGRVIESKGLKVNESNLTGETNPILKTTAALTEATILAEKNNCVFAGSFVSEGRGWVLVTDVGDNTQLGIINSSIAAIVETLTPLQERLEVLAGQIAKISIAVSAIIFCVKLYQMPEWTVVGVKEAFTQSVALIVAAVPEGLPTMIAVTLAINSEKMQKLNALVREAAACETIGSINYICSDKTGTLTQNLMTVVRLWIDGDFAPVDKIEDNILLQNFMVNSTADVVQEDGKAIKRIGNPTECALVECAALNGFDYKTARSGAKVIHTKPFSSDTKSMSTVIEIEGNGKYAVFTKGAPERVLAMCTKIRFGKAVIALSDSIRADIEKEIAGLQGQAMRTLGFAYAEMRELDTESLESNMIFIGFVGIEDPLRPDVYDAITDCSNAGIKTVMLTGDTKITAMSIAKQLGMLAKGELVFETAELEKLSDDELKKIIEKITVVARCTPSMKERFVRLLKDLGNSVAVTGDGVNDTIALKTADVGISMGITGTETAKAAAGIILIDDSFTTIGIGVKWGRAIYENIQRFLTFQLTVNIVAFGTSIIAALFNLGLPLTTLQLLWINIIMDGPPALSLGLEPPRDDLMTRKPIPRKADILTKDMKIKIATNGGYIIAAILALMTLNPTKASVPELNSMVFTTFVLFQLFNSLNCREFNNASIIPNMFNNMFSIKILSVTFALQVIITQYGGEFFRTVPLSLGSWVFMIAYAGSIIVFAEGVKIVSSMVTSKKAGNQNVQEF